MAENRAAEVGTGRWHVRLVHPANIVTFADFWATSVADATAQAQKAYPGYTVEWAVLETSVFGVWQFPTNMY